MTTINIFNSITLVNLPSYDDIIFDDDGDGTPNEDDVTDDTADDGEDVTDDDTTGGEGEFIGGLSGTGDDTSGGDTTDEEGDDDDDDDDDDDEEGDDDTSANPNDGFDQFSPILPRFIFIGIFVFNNVPSGRWVDPPSADGFEYEMAARDIPVGVPSRVFPGMTGVGQADDSVFTRISGFPINVDADDTFVVSVDGTVLGEFNPGDTLRFTDYAELLGDRLVDGGVRKFTISEINPAVDSSNPVAFPLQLEFNTNTASFEMRALEAADTRISSAVDSLVD
ncbi:MAG: hypothetical protein O3A14_06930 [Cyanobacteria bacterium]|nr:hypothetical protein [Cyanobacteriota bacterium]